MMSGALQRILAESFVHFYCLQHDRLLQGDFTRLVKHTTVHVMLSNVENDSWKQTWIGGSPSCCTHMSQCYGEDVWFSLFFLGTRNCKPQERPKQKILGHFRKKDHILNTCEESKHREQQIEKRAHRIYSCRSYDFQSRDQFARKKKKDPCT